MITLPNRRTIRSSFVDRLPNQNQAPLRRPQNAQAVAMKLCAAARTIFAR